MQWAPNSFTAHHINPISYIHWRWYGKVNLPTQPAPYLYQLHLSAPGPVNTFCFSHTDPASTSSSPESPSFCVSGFLPMAKKSLPLLHPSILLYLSRRPQSPSSYHTASVQYLVLPHLVLICMFLKHFSSFGNLSPNQMGALKMRFFSLWFFPLCPQGVISTRNSLPGHKVFPDVA